ncbi:hypothetical protein JKF63_02026 [Porcisia hertigi]|uniref:Uncharacterized protein n=1 Tax=Porcisia hertigi TaxID=2761500 RepID=A0A836L1P2_9TRYP|nr:hypothetical protein JKF63_02026 [Porcisia hertigi]
MRRLAEYQAELVDILGHAMRDAILDNFFDDGSDPALSALQRKRDGGAGARSAIYAPAYRDRCTITSLINVWVGGGRGHGRSTEVVFASHTCRNEEAALHKSGMCSGGHLMT